MTAAATANTNAAAEKPKSKKLLFIILGVVLVALIGAGAALFILMKNTAEDEDDLDEATPASQTQSRPRTPPAFLPLENMVVNLADPGGNRFVQVGITLQLQDAKTGEDMKTYMPSIRSAILMLISQQTSDEVLQLEGKNRLSKNIIREISEIMGYEYEDEESERSNRRRRAPPNPIQAVLFSSFIVQ
ncbi:MAG TPA: flagellar basal body-associated FliL family protein [Hydrogenophaga sp.]|uniref:flagellar basal body-associated FliL family protein n=1 Tax=Hydrogenophaga sp. TaxID=1904254 RepID=UPI002D195391|nr:flagellar basal body-associated FliL family protein [Hydrogenophaga sp.]HMN92464.1 flagellar basal body-associated FliL family protein [Hydrogenophaga sp.]HMP11061.1 flagellar basal body-associated FliL family protein [Hydrogenophaga sp.]